MHQIQPGGAVPPHGGSQPAGNAAGGRTRRPGEWTLFAPMAFDGRSWERIARPQPDARAACMSVTTHIHLLQEGFPLGELDARAESAVRALEDGAVSIAVIDDVHRVDRIFLCSVTGFPDWDAPRR